MPPSNPTTIEELRDKFDLDPINDLISTQRDFIRQAYQLGLKKALEIARWAREREDYDSELHQGIDWAIADIFSELEKTK